MKDYIFFLVFFVTLSIVLLITAFIIDKVKGTIFQYLLVIPIIIVASIIFHTKMEKAEIVEKKSTFVDMQKVDGLYYAEQVYAESKGRHSASLEKEQLVYLRDKENPDLIIPTSFPYDTPICRDGKYQVETIIYTKKMGIFKFTTEKTVLHKGQEE